MEAISLKKSRFELSVKLHQGLGLDLIRLCANILTFLRIFLVKLAAVNLNLTTTFAKVTFT